MTARATARRRISLLASSSLVATTLMAGAGGLGINALAPSQALAACTAGHPGPTDFVCTDPTLLLGFAALPGVSLSVTHQTVNQATWTSSTSDGSNDFAMDAASSLKHVGAGDALTLTSTTGNISTTTPTPPSGIAGVITNDTGRGIVVSTTTGNFTGAVSAAITTKGDGIDIASTSGVVNLTTSGVIATTAGHGIEVVTAGNVTIATKGAISTVGNTQGIRVFTTSGAGAIDVTAGADIASPASAAIFLNSDSGAIKINVASGATMTGGGPTWTVIGQSNTGNVTLNNDGDIDGANGVLLSTNAGNLVYSGVGSVTGNGGDGITAVAFGGAGTTNITTDGAVFGKFQGINVNTFASTGLVTVTTNDTVTSSIGDGISIVSGGGVKLTTNDTVTGDPAIVILDNSAVGVNIAVNADALGMANAVDITEIGAGLVTVAIAANVTVNGDTDANLAGDGVVISATTGAVKLTSAATSKITGANGVNITVVDSDVKVATDGAVTATSGSGIIVSETSALGTGDIEITANGPISAVAWGINALAQGANDIKIVTGPGGDITGAVIGVQAFAAGGGTIDIDTSGDIGDALTPMLNGIFAITGSTAEVTIGVHGDILTLGDAVLNLGAGGHTSVTTTAGSDITSKLGQGIFVAGFKDADLVVDGNVTGGIGGILAVVTNDVNLDYSGAITATDPASKGVELLSSGGDIDVDRTSAVGGAISAGQVGIYAQTSGAGTIDVGFSSPFGIGDISKAQAAGIETHSAAGTNRVQLEGDIEGAAFKGIYATTTTGGIAIISAFGSQIGSAANGVDNAGIYAEALSGTPNSLQVQNFGDIHVDSTGLYGILANNALGTGTVLVVNTGIVGTPLVGINALGGKDVQVTNTGQVTGVFGIASESFGATGNATVLQLGTQASTTGLGGFGIQANAPVPGPRASARRSVGSAERSPPRRRQRRRTRRASSPSAVAT